MTVANSTRQKPSKPYPEFPLFVHNNGQWCRKIRGKLYSFGMWEDPTAALNKHNAEYEHLKEDIAPPTSRNGGRVGDLINELSRRIALIRGESRNARLRILSTSASW